MRRVRRTSNIGSEQIQKAGTLIIKTFIKRAQWLALALIAGMWAYLDLPFLFHSPYYVEFLGILIVGIFGLWVVESLALFGEAAANGGEMESRVSAVINFSIFALISFLVLVRPY